MDERTGLDKKERQTARYIDIDRQTGTRAIDRQTCTRAIARQTGTRAIDRQTGTRDIDRRSARYMDRQTDTHAKI